MTFLYEFENSTLKWKKCSTAAAAILVVGGLCFCLWRRALIYCPYPIGQTGSCCNISKFQLTWIRSGFAQIQVALLSTWKCLQLPKAILTIGSTTLHTFMKSHRLGDLNILLKQSYIQSKNSRSGNLDFNQACVQHCYSSRVWIETT